MASSSELDRAAAIAIDRDGSDRNGRRARSRDARARIDPEIKSWIDNVLVPALVDEFLSTADLPTEKSVARSSRPGVSLPPTSLDEGAAE